MRTRNALFALLLSVGVAVLGACQRRPRTELGVIVGGDAAVRGWATSLSIEVTGRASGATLFDTTDTTMNSGTWPTQVGVVPTGGDASRVVRVLVTATGGGHTLTSVAETSFVAGETRALHVYLSEDCESETCEVGSTCRRGLCEAQFIPASTLPMFGDDAGLSPIDGAPTDAARMDGGGTDAGSLDAGVDASGDANCIPAATKVDLLILIDTSGSMTEEQELIRLQVPELVRALQSGDVDGDGIADYAPVTDLQVAIITPDLGASVSGVPNCDIVGDSAILRGTSEGAGCTEAGYGPVLRFISGTDSTAALADTSCLVQAGARGCGLEQQLEALLEASSPDGPTSYTAAGYTAPMFADGSRGRGETDNVALFRPDAVLAMVLFTDEEDCSARSPAAFFSGDPSAVAAFGSWGTRCVAHPEELHPVSRFIDGITQLRTDLRRMVFVPVVGLPTSLNPGVRTVPDYAGILADARMTPMVDGSSENIVDACASLAGGSADPGRRYVEVAAGLAARGVHTTVQSICMANYGPVIRSIAYRIGQAAEATCP